MQIDRRRFIGGAAGGGAAAVTGAVAAGAAGTGAGRGAGFAAAAARCSWAFLASSSCFCSVFSWSSYCAEELLILSSTIF